MQCKVAKYQAALEYFLRLYELQYHRTLLNAFLIYVKICYVRTHFFRCYHIILGRNFLVIYFFDFRFLLFIFLLFYSFLFDFCFILFFHFRFFSFIFVLFFSYSFNSFIFVFFTFFFVFFYFLFDFSF